MNKKLRIIEVKYINEVLNMVLHVFVYFKFHYQGPDSDDVSSFPYIGDIARL